MAWFTELKEFGSWKACMCGFETQAEAEQYGRDIFSRQKTCEDARAFEEKGIKPLFRYKNGDLTILQA